jgi:hypothetical protein
MNINEKIKLSKQELLEKYSITTDKDLIKKLGLNQEQKNILFAWIKYQGLFEYRNGLNDAPIILKDVDSNKIHLDSNENKSNSNDFFTEEEVDNFKNGSIHYPLLIHDGTNERNIVEVNEIVMLSGMASNNGDPAEITIYKHQKGKEKKELVYRMVFELKMHHFLFAQPE